MKYDIGDLLNSWPFDPDEFIARRIIARDGTEKIQIRIDMGMLQLEVSGRPDGQRPFGAASLLEHYESSAGKGAVPGYPELDDEACEELFQEAWQYYQRYLSLFYLEDYAGVIEDTGHNLDIFDLVQQRAASDEVKWYFEQYYPHAIMMQARAKAMQALDKEDYRSALREVENGIERIEGFLAEWEGETIEEDFPELSFLRDWHEELEKERPLSHREQLERDLNVAVEAENFEEAARLRDKLRTMRPFLKGPSAERSSLT
ncbi:MAG: UvrB/UvrC motif-containing protein [Gemmatimonadetes bacterium]|nr:UvrB/UvrC motif-containing protein [Gemmatimonadota bacterium]